MSAPVNFNGTIPAIEPSDAVMLLIDHQSGLFQVVKDIPLLELRANVAALALPESSASSQRGRVDGFSALMLSFFA